MANRGRQTFNKRLKEQQRKEKQQEKFARKMQRKIDGPTTDDTSDDENPLAALREELALESRGAESESQFGK